MAPSSSHDTGYAWIVCAASFCINTLIGGFLYTSGMFYIMFKNGLDAEDSALALITSLNIGTIYTVCPIIGILTPRYGERHLSIAGAVVATGGLACSAFSTEVYHLYISYGLIAGIGMAMVYNPATSILNVYFLEKRRLANGLAFTGLGFGSCIFPPILKALENTYGWRGAVLIMAGITAQNAIFCTFLRSMNHSSTGSQKSVGKTEEKSNNKKILSILEGENSTIVHDRKLKDKIEISMTHTIGGVKSYSRENNTTTDNSLNSEEMQSLTMSEKENNQKKAENMQNILLIFKKTPFLCLIGFSLLVFFPISFVYTHFGNYALTLGIPSNHVVLLYTVMGITSTITRPLSAVIAHATKANTAFFIFITITLLGVLTVLLPHTTQLPFMYGYAVTFQSLMSPYNVLVPTIVMESVPTALVPVAFGVVCLLCTPGTVLGAPLAAWFYSSSNVYAYSFYLAGGLYLLSGLVMVPSSIFLRRSQNQHI